MQAFYSIAHSISTPRTIRQYACVRDTQPLYHNINWYKLIYSFHVVCVVSCVLSWVHMRARLTIVASWAGHLCGGSQTIGRTAGK